MPPLDPATQPDALSDAMLLAITGGLLDAVVFLLHGHVFASSMTGNLVFLGIAILSRDWADIVAHLRPPRRLLRRSPHLQTSSNPPGRPFRFPRPGTGDRNHLRPRLATRQLSSHGIHLHHRLRRRHPGRQIPPRRPFRLQLHLHHRQPSRYSRRSLRRRHPKLHARASPLT